MRASLEVLLSRDCWITQDWWVHQPVQDLQILRMTLVGPAFERLASTRVCNRLFSCHPIWNKPVDSNRQSDVNSASRPDFSMVKEPEGGLPALIRCLHELSQERWMECPRETGIALAVYVEASIRARLENRRPCCVRDSSGLAIWPQHDVTNEWLCDAFTRSCSCFKNDPVNLIEMFVHAFLSYALALLRKRA